MKLVFAGSPEFAIPTLEKIVAAGHEILCVITQPDRPVGREQRVQPPPVKDAALRHGLRIEQPEKIKGEQARALLEEIRPEAVVVVGYGQILPPWLLNLPRYGCINLHASLLPAYRGAAPIQWAVANGESSTGVTTMLMDPGMDTGPALLQWSTAIDPEETAPELSRRMSFAGADLMLETLKGVESGALHPQPQDSSRATRAPLLKKEDGLIDWRWPARQIFNRIRGFDPWPGAYSGFRGKKLQIWRARPLSGQAESQTGGEMLVSGGGLRVACGGGSVLELLEVQLEGRKRMPVHEFLHGVRPDPGERLEIPA